ncbi:Ig-like domain-containing protein [Hymenobacter yonginensis]|uniref:Ig-like domain-containing protein n=1 Tax=Hymenobacter yonginensis TaxID=748197 RepID=A0ABY7PUZ7_9BACT|nr:Ig-like domain-containing protein [Hymenobacter yonginensis]WBO86757.1 Ig-like domain-containing protein [Hymenobacter yonginensis]
MGNLPSSAQTKLYWTQSSGTAADDRLSSANLDGTGRLDLASGNGSFDNPQALAVDVANNRVYVGDGGNAGNTGIRRYNLATGALVDQLVAGTTGISINALQVVGNKLYWVQSSGTAASDQLCSANLDGSGLSVLASGNSATTFLNPQSLWVDAENGFIYVGDGAGASSTGLSRFTLAGSFSATLVAGSAAVSYNGVQKAGSKLYWVQSSGTAADDRLSSANLDGSGRTDLASGNSATTFINPQALWVDAVNSQIYVGDGAGTGSTGISRFTLTGTYVSNVVAGSTASINAIGSNQQSATAPAVTTATPTSITTTGATLGGNVTADGGATVTERGVVYVAGTGTPTTSNTKLTSAGTTGSFTVNATGLTAGTQYTVRAYAINSAGTSYGASQTFTSASPAAVTAITRTGNALTNTASVSYTVTFSASVSGLTTANFAALTTGSVSGASVSSLSGSGSTYTVSVNTGTGDGTVQLQLSNATGLTPGVSNVPFAGDVITIDKTAPTVVSISRQVPLTSLTNATSYTFRVTFSEDVTNVRSGLFSTTYTGLTLSGFFINVVPVSGSVYDVTAGDYAGEGTIKLFASNGTGPNRAYDLAGNEYTLPFGGSESYVVDNVRPTTTTVSVPANGTYGAGQQLNFAATFRENVFVGTSGSAPSLPLTIGTTARQAAYVSGSGTSALVFRYIIQAGEQDADGVTLGAALNLNSSTIRDVATNDAVLTLTNVGSTAGVLVDAEAPTVVITSPASSPTSTSPIPVTVTFSESVTGFVLADVSVSNGTPSGFAGSGISYSFSVTPTAAGAVTVSIPANAAQDASGNNNSASTPYTITFAPVATLSAGISAQTNVSCNGGATGAATVTATGGTAPYTYQWSNGATTATTTGLTAGTYNVVVTDAANRTASASATITEPAALTSTVAVTNVACFGGSTGAINLTPGGGTAPYTFNWGGGIASEDRTSLAAGTYSVTITDANGCTRTQSATISQPATALNVSLSKTDATANGAADGTATATPAGGTPGYTYLWSNGQTTATATSLPAGTYSVTVTDANNCQVTSGSVVVSQPTPAPQNLTISTGTPAAPVAIAAGTYNNITITGTGVAQLSGAVTVNGTFSVAGSLDTNCQSLTGPGSFTLADQATLLICDLNGIAASGSSGAVQLTGTRSFSPGASYVYNNLTPNTPQITGSGLPSQVRNLTTTSASNTSSFSISRPVAIREVYDVAGNVGGVFSSGITLLSDASGTALVNMGSTRPADTYTVQRYIDPTTNAGVGYRHIAMLPSSATVASYLGSGGTTPVFNTAYNTSATPLSTTPFPTVFGYDQARLATSPATGLSPFDKGWFSPAGTETVVGRSPRPTAYTVQLPGASTLSFLTNDRTSFTYSLARNSGATAADAGWNFVANPFLAPLDWSTVPASQRTNVDAAMYVFESTSQYGGQYRSYANGIGASPLIGLAQGFWVRVSEGQTSGSLNLLTANRVTTYNQQAPVRRGAADSRPQLQLQLAGATGPADDLFVYAQAGATAGLDAEFDAAKLPNSSGLNLASLTAAGELLAIDGRPAFGSAAATSIPLSVAVPQAGTYTFTAAALHNLPVGTRAELVDKLTGTRTVLAAGTRYAFSLSTTTAPGRFSLNLAPAGVLSSGAAALAAQVSVFPNPSTGLVTVLRPATGTASAEVLNALGQVVRRVALPTAETRLDLRELPTGIYTLRLTTPQGTVSKRLVRE